MLGLEYEEDGRVRWEYCKKCHCSRPMGHDYHYLTDTPKPTWRNTMFGTNKKDLEEQVITLKAAFETAETKIEDLQRSLKRQAEDHSDDRKKWEKERAELKDAEAIISKRFDDQKALAYKTMELEFKGKMQDQEKALRNELDVRLRAALDENFTKLKDSLSKLHEEGNAQTKFTEQIALKMMDAIKVQNIPKIEG